jgi:DNA-binding NarL/FixJ family response regulator
MHILGVKLINIIVAEPNQTFRLGIRSILERRAEFSVTEEVLDADQLRTTFLDVPHDVVVIGVDLLKQIGPAALRELRQARPSSRFLVHSFEIDTAFGAEAFRFGATGYMANDCSSSELCDAVMNVAAGQPFVTRLLGEQLATAVCFRASNLSHASLSRRELVVFKMLSTGLRERDVARQLGKSVDDIYAYKTHIMAKMTLPDESALVQHAISQTVLQAFDHYPEMHPVH